MNTTEKVKAGIFKRARKNPVQTQLSGSQALLEALLAKVLIPFLVILVEQ